MRLMTADGRELWLGYGMNVHAGSDVRTTLDAIRSTVLPLKARLGVHGPFGLAVRWSAAGLEAREDLETLRGLSRDHDLRVFTGNAFVHGDFHGRPLKDAVYRPAWGEAVAGGTDPRRRYTETFAAALARLAGPGSTVSLSTSPCAWKGWGRAGESERLGRFAAQLRQVATALRALEDDCGVHVELGLEPEPGCTIETTAEMLAFARGPLAAALDAAGTDLGPYLGVCYDVCHQAVEWEDVQTNLRALRAAGLRIVKLQASCALELPDPADASARAALARFDEPVYLHQVGARDADGRVHVAEDLGQVLQDPAWHARGPWRSHFHVPVFRREVAGGLRTTQPDLERALRLVAREDITRHIEIETYTWDVLPDAEKFAGSGFDLVAALEREMRWVLGILAEEGTHPLDTEDAA